MCNLIQIFFCYLVYNMCAFATVKRLLFQRFVLEKEYFNWLKLIKYMLTPGPSAISAALLLIDI